MEKKETFLQFLISRLGKCIYASVGLFIFAIGTYFQIQANFGMAPWNALNQGLSMNFPITYGQASILISAIIIVVDLIMREPIGLGTILNAVLIGIGSDICIELGFLPVQDHVIMQTVFLLVGMAIVSFGQFVYIGAGLSAGPRDSLLVGLGKRFPKVSLGNINLVILAVVFACALLLRSPFGLGTVISVVCSGAVMDFVFKLVKFNPKTIKHESLPGTIAAMMRSLKK